MNTPLRAVPQAFAHVRRFIFANRDKVPCDFYGNPCDPHNPAKWLTITELKSSPLYFDPRYFIGFVFARGDRRFGIDLDKCFDQAGMITPAAAAVLERFPGAYVEVSISGTGLHIIGTGEVGPHRTRAPGLELYTEGRYFLLTGSQARGDAGLDFTPALGAFVDAYGLHKAPEDAGAAVIPDDGPRPGSTGFQYPDSELIAIMLAAGGGAALRMGEKAHPRDLWHANAEALTRFWPQPGRRDGCPFDRSAAEAALLMHLSWYTGGHVSRMITLFRQSALYREGMDDAELWRKHAVPICKAVAGVKFFDQPRALPGLPAPAGAPGMVMPQAPMPALVTAAHAILGEIEPLEWTVDGWIPHKALTLFGGDGGIGKTTLSLQLALAAAGMRPWLGRFVKLRRVLFVSGEDSINRLTRAVKRIAGRMEHDASNLFLLSLDGFINKSLVTVDRNGVANVTPTTEHIMQMMRANGIDMVIFDPIANLWSGNEIDRDHVTKMLTLLRNRFADELSATVVINAHPSREGIKDGSGYSGSSAWNNSVRARLYLGKVGDKDNKQRVLELAKANDGQPGQQIIMSWEDGLFVSDASSPASSNEMIDDVFMAILERRMKLGMFVSPKPSPTYAPTVFVRDEGAQGISKREFENAMMRLKEVGKIDFITEGPESKQRTHIVPTPLPTRSN